MNEVTKFFGIDVSMDTLDVSTFDQKHFKFSNDVEGYRMLLKLLDDQSQCVMEATGAYHQKLATWLYSHCISVSVVNPIVIKRFAQMRLRLAKTDKADANMIRQYAEAEKPEVWSPPEEYVIQAGEINGLITLLIRQRTALKNKLHSVNHKEGTFSMI
jgi:transposase